MSVCTFIASDCPLKEAAPVQDYPLEINLDNGQIYDVDADDNYFVLPFADVREYHGAFVTGILHQQGDCQFPVPILFYSDQLPSALPDSPPVLYPLLSCQSERQSVF